MQQRRINLMQGSIPSFESGIRFIVNDALGLGEVRLTNARFKSKEIIPQLLAKNYNFYEDLLPEIKIRNSSKKERNSD